MITTSNIIQQDLQHIWHPCMQMKDFEAYPPIVVERAQGSLLHTNKGPLIDGISSWWCKSLGHRHPAIIQAIQEQLNQFEHVIAANTTHPKLAEFGETLASLTGNQHVFFASDGSSAVEIAMKLAIHANQIQGRPKKNKFIALKNAYHGETLGTISVGDLGLYKQPYEQLQLDCHFIQNIPYVNNQYDPLWIDSSSVWQDTENSIAPLRDEICAVIVEPIVQGAGGMKCYSADFLTKLAHWAKQNNIYLIVDEIMTGIGRTGEWLASHHANIQPDMICLSKGLTSGTIPLSCVSLSHSIYELFYADYPDGKSFLHSHTHSANALGVSAALATLKTMQEENTIQQAQEIGHLMLDYLSSIASTTQKLSNVRGIGAVVAADLIHDGKERMGNRVYQEAIELGLLIRPIGNTLYWLPPLNTDKEIIAQLAEITLNSINKVYKRL